MGFFRARSKYTGPVIEGRPWNDPALATVLDALPASAPEQAVVVALDFLRPLRADLERHVQALDAFVAALTSGPAQTGGSAEELRRRADRPASDDPGTRADLLVLLGRVLIVQAWEVRSSRPAAEVSQNAFRGFAALLHEAEEALVVALQTVPQHPGAAVARLITARGLGAAPEEFWRRFDEATALRKSLYPAHVMMLMALCRKWYGSDEQMFDFGRRAAATAAPGDPVVAMLPLAHVEYLSSLVMQQPAGGLAEVRTLLADAREADLRSVLEASQRWCGDTRSPVPVHPYAIQAHQLFAWYLADCRSHQKLARWHLEQAQGRMATMPWTYLSGDPVAVFRATHTRLGIS